MPKSLQLAGSVGAVGGHDFNVKIVRIIGAISVSIHAAERANHEREEIMNLRRWQLLLLGTLAAAVAPPAWGQTVVPGVGTANSGTQGAASIPDFSGIWAHLSWPDFEPPLAGPGPVTNRARQNGRSNIY